MKLYRTTCPTCGDVLVETPITKRIVCPRGHEIPQSHLPLVVDDKYPKIKGGKLATREQWKQYHDAWADEDENTE